MFFMVNFCGFRLFSVTNESIRGRRVALIRNECNPSPSPKNSSFNYGFGVKTPSLTSYYPCNITLKGFHMAAQGNALSAGGVQPVSLA